MANAIKKCALVLLACMLTAGCSRKPVMVASSPPPLPTPFIPPETPAAEADPQTIQSAALFNDFTLKLLAHAPQEENPVISGASAGSLLYHLAAFADEEGQAQYQAFFAADLPEREALLATVTRMEGQYNTPENPLPLHQQLAFGEGPLLMETYLEAWKDGSCTNIRFVDFASETSVKDVNDAIRHWAPGMKGEPFQTAQENAPQLVLTDAVQGNITWKTGFDPENTQKKLFHREDGAVAGVMMMQARLPMVCYEGEDAILGILPAAQNREVWLLMPQEGVSLSSLLEDLSTAVLTGWRSQAQDKDCNLTLPIVQTLTYGFLDPVLQACGGQSLYLDGAWGYPDMGTHIALDHLYQTCSLSFQEEGETVVHEVGGSHALAPHPELIGEITLDRPFAVLVVDRQDGGILLAAAITTQKAMRTA